LAQNRIITLRCGPSPNKISSATVWIGWKTNLDVWSTVP